jgi:hypothetical protein
VTPSEVETYRVTFADMKDARTGRVLTIPRDEAVGKFDVWQENGFCHAENHAVKSGLYTVAKVDDADPYKFYFRELNYHPDGTQMVVPLDKSPFIMLLGSSPSSLKAYIFDGTHGFDIFPGVWHQPPLLHYEGRMTFANKQAASHICAVYDSVKETGTWLFFEYA